MIISSNLKTQISKLRGGFTLLEMLVVISIISILVALGATSYSTAQKKGRDSRRTGDLRGIASSLEQYYSVCGGLYPSPNSGLNTIYTYISCPNPTIGIMPSVPVDPKGTPYLCKGTCGSTGYTICSNNMETGPTQYCINSQQ